MSLIQGKQHETKMTPDEQIVFLELIDELKAKGFTTWATWEGRVAGYLAEKTFAYDVGVSMDFTPNIYGPIRGHQDLDEAETAEKMAELLTLFASALRRLRYVRANP